MRATFELIDIKNEPFCMEKNNNTAIETAYSAIKERIFSFDYAPGYHLKETELSDMLSISRTPVREAVRLLVDEGLVEVRPNGRCHVMNVDAEEIDSLFELAATLESMCAKMCAENITDEQLVELKHIQSRLDNVNDEEDVDFLEENAKFHALIHDCCGSKHLLRLVKQVRNTPALCYLKGGVHTGHAEANHQHNDIIHAISRRDGKLAEIAMRMHIEMIRAEYTQILAESEQ